MVSIFLVWFFIWLIYVLHDKIERCVSNICAKCRGDGEFEYDSEVDELEHIEENSACKRCQEESRRKEERKQQIKEMFRLEQQDNNKLD